jgi:CheY-like chemotaxis protein
MKGEIGHLDNPEGGSIFWFEIPLQLQTQQTSDYEASFPIPDCRVLILDDLDVNRTILQELIIGWGIHCDVAPSGSDALAMLRKAVHQGKHYHIVIADYHMPHMDGIVFGRKVKEDPELKDSVLIMLSSVGDHFSPGELEDCGFIDFILKPINSLKLLEILQKSWNKSLNRLNESIKNVIDAKEIGSSQKKQALPILVVEDNVPNQIVTKAMLESLGFVVNIAANGEEAVGMWKNFPYQLIFMDLSMPVMSGVEAISIIRKQEKENNSLRPIPIIVLTAQTSEGMIEKCNSLDIQGALSKPIKIHDLRNAINNLDEATNSLGVKLST